MIHRKFAQALFIFGLVFVTLLKADDVPMQFPPPTAEQIKAIQEKSLNSLRDIKPSSSSGRKLETMAIDGGLVYWGNFFDPNEVVALVNLSPEKPTSGDWLPTNSWEVWPCYLSLCAWEKNHWVYRQYLDNAHTLTFHDRKDSPHHFVQASHKTGRYEGDYLSWYYNPKTKTLVRTNYETWGPFFLLGNYLCTTNGFERRSMNETVWVYPYKDGKKGDLLAIHDSYVGGERPNFSITFRDHQTRKLWTYSFHQEADESPYTVDAVEGQLYEKAQRPAPRIHYSARIKVSGADDQFDSFCFERLTKLSCALVGGVADGDGDWQNLDWNEVLPKTPPVKEIKFEISGDPEILQHLKSP